MDDMHIGAYVMTFLGQIWDSLNSLSCFGLSFTYGTLLKYILIFNICFCVIFAVIKMRTSGDIVSGIHTMNVSYRHRAPAKPVKKTNIDAGILKQMRESN